MAARRPTLRTVLPPIVVIVGMAVLVKLAYDPWYLNYDTRYALVWARDLWHGMSPDYSAPFAPTPHPLWTAIGSLALPFSDHADTVMTWLVLLSFGAVVWLVYALAAELFNRPVAIAAALVVASRPAMYRDAVLVYLDVPFAALILGAVLLEVRRPRRGAAVLAVLAVAGLLRPEAWLLSLLYLAHCWRGRAAGERARLTALALLGPVVWFASDALITGDALHSLHGTAHLAQVNHRRRTLGEAPYWTLQYFGYTLRLPVLAGVLVGAFFALRRRVRDQALLPLVVAVVLVVVFAAGPIAGLPLIGRYVRTPSALLAVYFGLACFGWTMIAPSRARRRWALAGWALVAAALVFVIPLTGLFDGLRGRRDRDAAFYSSLRSAAHAPAVRAAFAACPKITAADHRPVPFLRWWLNGPPGSVGTVERHSARPTELFIAPRPSKVAQHFYGQNFPHARPPAGAHEIYRNDAWRVFAEPRCDATG